MQMSNIAALANLFTALSDQTRLRLLSLMIDGEVSVGYLAEMLDESQPKISRHLAYLRTAGLVSTRRDGKWIYYEIAAQADAAAEHILQTTLGLIAGQNITSSISRARTVLEDAPVASEIYVEPDMGDWQPAEIDVFLL